MTWTQSPQPHAAPRRRTGRTQGERCIPLHPYGALTSRAQRTVLCKDAICWLRDQTELGDIVTSMPDVSEIKSMTLEVWREWCAVRSVILMSL